MMTLMYIMYQALILFIWSYLTCVLKFELAGNVTAAKLASIEIHAPGAAKREWGTAADHIHTLTGTSFPVKMNKKQGFIVKKTHYIRGIPVKQSPCIPVQPPLPKIKPPHTNQKSKNIKQVGQAIYINIFSQSRSCQKWPTVVACLIPSSSKLIHQDPFNHKNKCTSKHLI